MASSAVSVAAGQSTASAMRVANTTDVVTVNPRVGLVGDVGVMRASRVAVSSALILMKDVLDLGLDLVHCCGHVDDLYCGLRGV
jgi:hypothetical protein